MAQFLSRGFIDYDDFKDQLEAVDLLLLQDNECNAAKRLYDICCNIGLVENVSCFDKDDSDD